MKTQRLKTPVTSSLTLQEAETLAQRIAQLMIDERRQLADLDTELKAVNAHHSKYIERTRARIKELFPQLQAWAETNRAEHFGKKKSIEFLHSIIGFDKGKPTVKTLKGWTWKKVVEKLESWNPAFLRQPPKEVDKQAIIADRDRLERDGHLHTVGLQITQTETFYLDPKATEPTDQQQPVEGRAAASPTPQAA